MHYFERNSIDPTQDGYPAVNDTFWPKFIEMINEYREVLEMQKPQRLLVRIPNTPEGAAVLLASSYIPVETIIVADYHHDDLVEKIVIQYEVSHQMQLKNGALICTSSRSSNAVISDQPYLCLLTSGTTGMPKCVKHTWKSLISRIKLDSKFKRCKWFLGYPITHFAGLQVMLQCLSNRGSLIIPPSYAPATCLPLIAEHKPEYINCTPTLVRQLFMSASDFDWKNCPVKRFTMGGEIVEQSIIDLIKQHIPGAKITHIYASTELGAILTIPDEKEGFPLELVDNSHLKIMNDELWVKPSESAMVQYLQADKLKQDEWIATKDIVEVTDSRVLFKGRTDDIINVGGFKVLPSTVEQVIRKLPAVQEAVVMGQSNPIVGNIVKAKIQSILGADHKMLKKEIIRICKESLPEYMVPGIIQFVDEISVTKTHKLLRRE